MNKDLIALVEKLRQEQEFVYFYKNLIRQSVQEVNNGCDQVFHSLWLCHTLSYGLHRVLSHSSYPYEWSNSYEHMKSVEFVNASKVVKSYLFVERYSRFFTNLLNDPRLLSEILYHVESEGLDCSWVVNDLMSVVYGHCMFKNDHMIFLKLMRELLSQHIERCDSPKDLFGGVESVFNHVLTEYCSQLVELRTFLTEVLHEPVMEVIACEEYLEFDVNKAGTRFQRNSKQNGLVGTGVFLFNEDLESSCKRLAKMSTHFLENLSLMIKQLPISLQWLLGNLKTMVKAKWPRVSHAELRRPISDAIFSSILSSVIVNPESYGVISSSVTISDIGRYNLSQIMSVLQGCVWIMDKPSASKYPIHKVVRRIDVNLFFSLVDGIDSRWSETIPDLPSFLPGFNRSAFLASQEQLDNMVGLIAMMVTNRVGKGDFHSHLSHLLNSLLPAIIDQASSNPYSITSKPFTVSSPSSINSLDYEKLKSLKRKGGKKTSSGNLEMMDVSLNQLHLQRGKMILNSPDGKSKTGGGGGGGGSDKQMKRSMSTDGGLSSSVAGGSGCGFQLPSVVLVFPVLDKQLPEGDNEQWNFYLLTEEEFMCQKSPSPHLKSDDQFYFTSLFHSRPVHVKSDFLNISNTPPVTTPGTHDSKVLMKTNRGRVKSMITALENDTRSRSNTLPTILSDSSVDEAKKINLAHGAGGAPTSPVLRRRPASEITSDQSDSLDFKDAVGQSNLAKNTLFTVRREPLKLSTTVETSVEDSVSYVRVHPSSLNDGASTPDHLGEVHPSFLNDNTSTRPKSLSSPTPPLTLEETRDEEKSSRERVNLSTSPGLDDTSDSVDKLQNKVQSESLINLYQEEEEEEDCSGTLQLEHTKQKKKKKWKLFKRRKSGHNEKEAKFERSHSDAPSRRDRVVLHGSDEEGEESGVKMRSISHDTFLDIRKGRGRVDRYTIYMQDYSTKLEEERKKQSPEPQITLLGSNVEDIDIDRGSTDDGLDREEDTPPAEMTPFTFKHSLFCNQLKYKLRSALQNIHSPLTLCPPILQLQVDRSKTNTRYQLILLIQHSLQHSRWRNDDMEVALLSEILRMVEPLPNELIQITIEGVFEDYYMRSSYIAYLVRSQQKFQDAKMQIGAVQQSIDRIMHINMEIFVNFAVRVFLEAPGQPRLTKLKEFSHQMETLFLADEKCSLMSEQLDSFKDSLSCDSITWEHWQDKDKVTSVLVDYLFTYTHQHIFYPNGPTDKEVDKIFSDHLATLSKTISMNHKCLQIPFVYHSGCPWMTAQKQLKVMSAYKSPHGKLHCIVQCLRILISLLQYAKCGDPPGADDLFPVLVYILIKANPPAMLSTCQYIRNFLESSLQGEDAYWWAQFSTAVEFTKTLN